MISNKPIRRSLTVGAVTAIIVAATVIGNGESAEALGKVKCGDPTAVAQVDPVVHHNETDNSIIHMHQIYGNNAWVNLENPNAANYEDLVGMGTNCRIPEDTAGYWLPCLQKRNEDGTYGPECISTNQFTAYYRPWTGIGGPDYGPGMPFPPDTRLVGHSYNFTCGNKSGARSEPVQVIPDCSGLSGKPGLTLTGHVDLPNCWDGVLPDHHPEDVGDTSDNIHYAYAIKVDRVKVCPDGFPNKMISIRETLQFAYVGDGSDVLLSSDVLAGTTIAGSTMHADFWQAWDDAFFDQWIHDCVNFNLGSASRCDP